MYHYSCKPHLLRKEAGYYGHRVANYAGKKQRFGAAAGGRMKFVDFQIYENPAFSISFARPRTIPEGLVGMIPIN